MSRGGQVPTQLVSDELRGLGPVGMALHGGATTGPTRILLSAATIEAVTLGSGLLA
jgi:hypothetical protein